MKREDLYFLILVLVLFLPFVLSASLYEGYKIFNAEHGMIMSFLKFAILATLGEMLGSRVASKRYLPKGFGLLPRMVVWGVLGMGINMAMIIFSKGTPQLLEALGFEGAVSSFVAEGFTLDKFWVALSVSVAMNTIFAPVFMTLHKITDMHIAECDGSLRALITPIQMGRAFQSINWERQWGFVFKKSIPLFWYPAHTITFLLPSEWRVLFAALLGVVLGLLLALASRR